MACRVRQSPEASVATRCYIARVSARCGHYRRKLRQSRSPPPLSSTDALMRLSSVKNSSRDEPVTAAPISLDPGLNLGKMNSFWSELTRVQVRALPVDSQMNQRPLGGLKPGKHLTTVTLSFAFSCTVKCDLLLLGLSFYGTWIEMSSLLF